MISTGIKLIYTTNARFTTMLCNLINWYINKINGLDTSWIMFENRAAKKFEYSSIEFL